MKNYFEILEVDIHASKEVIDKAFKVLAKKYHPDTQDDSKKAWAEEQFKLLNEAYEVLSDDVKREEYTKKLEFDKNNKIDALMLRNADLEIQIEDLQMQLENLKLSSSNSSTFYDNDYQRQTQRQSQSQTEPYRHSYVEQPQYTVHQQEPVYYEAYYHPIKSRLKSVLAFFITISILVLVAFLIWKIPYTHNLLMEFYKTNSVIQSIFKLLHW